MIKFHLNVSSQRKTGAAGLGVQQSLYVVTLIKDYPVTRKDPKNIFSSSWTCHYSYTVRSSIAKFVTILAFLYKYEVSSLQLLNECNALHNLVNLYLISSTFL